MAKKQQWYHFMPVVIGFFTDAYGLFCITTVTGLLGRIYYPDISPLGLPQSILCAVTGVALSGTLAGQLFFWYMGDILSRKKVYGMTLMLIIVCSIAQGLCFSRSKEAVISTLCFFRFWLGFGIGGDYRLSATIMSEHANQKTRRRFLAAVLAMQSFGILAGGLVALIVSAQFIKYERDFPLNEVVRQADYVWRIILMFGTLPAALTFYWRMKMPETARYTAGMSRVLKVDIEENQRKRQPNEPEFGLFSVEFLRRHGLHLVGNSSTLFLLGIAFYSQNLFQNDSFYSFYLIPEYSGMRAIGEVATIALAQVGIAMVSIITAYWFTVFLIERLGHFVIQLVGFFFMFALAGEHKLWVHHNKIGFLILYVLTFSFANFGPNSTTFILMADPFPARFRSTGAIFVAVGVFYFVQVNLDVMMVLSILSITSALGFIVTFLVPLEEISEDPKSLNALAV